MAKQETLQAEKREVKGTTASKRLRRSGIVPAVIYGASQREYMIQLDAKKFTDIAKKHGENFLVNLEIDGAEEKSKLAIVQDTQKDPLTHQLVHVDFRAVSETDTIHAVVPIHLTGEPAGVKSGGILEQLIHSIEINCRPGDLPESIDNDVSELQIGESLRVGDLNLPDGVSVKMDDEVLVGLVTQTRAAVSAGGDEGEEGAAEGAEDAAEGEGSGDSAE
ncbi:MAG: 50S ribosomal protein L25 [Verrucomicrobiales bacterium]|nr:50S ribosomal protein L25 [Verrucomicrobiales bacterium]